MNRALLPIGAGEGDRVVSRTLKFSVRFRRCTSDLDQDQWNTRVSSDHRIVTLQQRVLCPGAVIQRNMRRLMRIACSTLSISLAIPYTYRLNFD